MSPGHPGASGSRLGHLARRFAGSLLPLGSRAADEAWACAQLLEPEAALWRRMCRADRRHAVGVARRVEGALGHGAGRPVLAAALLHDVGKVACGLGTYGRVVATVAGSVAGYEAAADWSRARGFTRKVGLYLRHGELGADMLTLAGSDPLTVAWARQHHAPLDQATLPPPIAQALKAADDD